MAPKKGKKLTRAEIIKTFPVKVETSNKAPWKIRHLFSNDAKIIGETHSFPKLPRGCFTGIGHNCRDVSAEKQRNHINPQ
jgi:hypothetical protein